MLQSLRVISTIWFLWGTYYIVWGGLERRFEDKRSKGMWWLAAKAAVFVVGLVSLSYVVLDRNNFEQAMTAFFTVFGVLTIFAVVTTFFFRARTREGSWAKDRVYLVIATIVLFMRSFSEWPYDITYGTLTCPYLVFMGLQAYHLDKGTADTENVQSDVRAWILDRLENVTQNHVLTAPAFSSILDDASAELALILEHGPLSLTSGLPADKKAEVAEAYVKLLRRQFSHLAPQPKTMPIIPPQPPSSLSPSPPRPCPVPSFLPARYLKDLV
ncbi:hypothetical protein B0T24DRAFT_680369 [Lasiosphaeria ovina]|uniref:Uncharacterized protein n=1 Tax=Lasiosphaeria ovina TaxID=92902 RepID=A0AAE0K745_9PEZI|nr:hypothetical protein B0T24DRAFT_680369 [Lasiosphaeria ovina]